MDAELLQSLEDVGYSGPMTDLTSLNKAMEAGPKSPQFTALISWLTNQISSFECIDETVHPTSTPEDANSFLMELSSYLKELGCVNQKLTTGNVNQRLANAEDRAMLLQYLITELMACKIREYKKPDNNKSIQITVSESVTAKNLREMLVATQFGKPPTEISTELLFNKLKNKVTEIVRRVPKDLLGKPLFFGELNENQWSQLHKIQGELHEEYTIRREMLLKRLDVTVNSFAWSERIRPKENELNKIFFGKRDLMKREPDVTLAHLFAARDDLAIIEKTSNATVRKNTRSQINRVIIGAVPDRGGRPCEQEPPPPEMPSWQKDRVAGPASGGRGSRGGRGGGNDYGNRGGGRGGVNSGYQDHKSVSSNFGQNYSSGYNNQSSGFNSGYAGQNLKGPTQVFYRTAPTSGNQAGNSQNRGGSRVQGGWNQGDNRNNYRGKRY